MLDNMQDKLTAIPTDNILDSLLNIVNSVKHVVIFIICSTNSTKLTLKYCSLPHKYPRKGAYIALLITAGNIERSRVKDSSVVRIK